MITNLNSKLRNSKWRFQYADEIQKVDPDRTRYAGVFRVADYESELKI